MSSCENLTVQQALYETFCVSIIKFFVEADSLFLHKHKVSDNLYKINNALVFLPLYEFYF